MPRDTLKDSSYWDAYIPRRDKTIARFEPLIFTEDRAWKDRIGFAYDVYMATFRKSVAAYSDDRAVSEIKDYFLKTINYLNTFVTLSKESPDYVLHEYAGGYDTRYQLLALAILLNIDRDIAKRLVAAIDFFPERDAIWEVMITALGVERKQKIDTLVWPEAYSLLWESIKLSAPNNADSLKKFVINWYKSMSDTPWHDSHKSKHNSYFGYWCFEAAAIAKLFNISNDELLSHPHYPHDLCHTTISPA